jgi:uncharacterized membrane protein YdbT with pleckstrin-like domain
MSYIQNNLMPNEKILYSARVHPAVFLPAGLALLFGIAAAIFGATLNEEAYRWLSYLIALMFLVMALRLGLDALIALTTTEFAVTNRRVVAKTGLFHRRTLEMLIPKVESVLVYQSLIGRIFNLGSVTVTGTGGTREKFAAIQDPAGVRKKINQIIEDYNQAYAEYQQRRTSVQP